MGKKRRLDRSLAAIREGRYKASRFILADAKDADMAFGVTAPGPVRDGAGAARFRTRVEYLDDMRAQIELGVFDIMLTSVSNGEVLAREGALGSDVTLAIRANDSTDIWNQRGGNAPTKRARPFRTVDLQAAVRIADLALYSITLNNDVDDDLVTVQAFKEFRLEAAELGMRYFLEVFNPNQPVDLTPHDVGAFVNDSIIRTLAGVTAAHRPLFLKVAYNGIDAMRELASHDPSLVVGILGGSAGTTRDTFELLHRAEQAGARVALFGRKIQRAESQLTLAALMRPVIEQQLTPAEAVRAYHGQLKDEGVLPMRSLEEDLQVTDPVLSSE